MFVKFYNSLTAKCRSIISTVVQKHRMPYGSYNIKAELKKMPYKQLVLHCNHGAQI